MTDKSRAVVELRFSDGSAISAWESFQYRENYTDPVGSFQFSVAPPEAKRRDYMRRLQKGERVQLAIAGNTQATCLISTVEQEIGDEGFSLSVECKGLLCTAYEASVDPFLAKTFANDTPITSVVLDALEPFGFDLVLSDASANVAAISGKSLSGRKPPPVLSELKLKDVQAQQGDTAFGICQRLFLRLGLMLRTDREGNLLLGSPDYEQAAIYNVVQDHDRSHSGDRMLRPIRIRDTIDGQFSETIVTGKATDRRGQRSIAQPVGGVIVPSVERSPAAPFTDTGLRRLPEGRHNYRGPWKPKYRLDKKSRDIELCRNFAEVMNGARAARAYTVQHSVDGLVSVSGGCVWAVDTVGRVIVEQAGIDENMWLLERVMRADRRGGQMTTLTWIPLHSLRLGEGG